MKERNDMKPKIKPVKGYCIWSPYAGLLYYSTGSSAKEAKQEFVSPLWKESWEDFYRLGYRCVRVVMSAEGRKR